MAFAGEIGLMIDAEAMRGDHESLAVACFAETPSRYLLEIDPSDIPALEKTLGGIRYSVIGRFQSEPRVTMGDVLNSSLDELCASWQSGLTI
jgi:phosphoribosylformylglycinamidine (FGAM) synthase-like enzyme